MSAPSTFERVYSSIKARLVAGDFHPGERLEPAHLSEDLNSSVTPVRDALHRLVGEQLVEAPKQEGFRAPVVSEMMLRWLYAWHRDLLLLALANRATRKTLAGPVGQQSHGRCPFLVLAEATGNPEYLHAIQSLIERLGPFQELEAAFLDDIEAESQAIAGAIAAGDCRELRRLLLAYHRRRAQIVPNLIASLPRS